MMNEIHFYSSKIKSILLLIVSAVFVYSFIYFYEEVAYKSLLIVIISHLGFVLFSFGIVYSLLLVFRKKPLLTVTDNEIIIFDLFRKKRLIPFENVASFFITSNSYRGIKTSDQINIVMKNGKPRKNKMINTILPQFENAQYTIQVDLLNIKTEKLIVILNSYLKNRNNRAEK